MINLRTIETSVLSLGYLEDGAPDATTVVLVHGWPDDALTWNAVARRLVEEGYRVVRPYLRGFGPTRFRDPGTVRSGQIAALGQDVVEFSEALGLSDFLLVGHDWGARAAYVAATLIPERIRGMVTLSVGHGTSNPDQPLSFHQARQYWYHWYFAVERGREALARDRRDFTGRLWRLWAPSWRYTEEEFDATAVSFDNPYWLEISIHSYRHRWGYAEGDPRYDQLERRLSSSALINVPTVMLHGAEDGATLPETSEGKEALFTAGYRREVLEGVGHFPQRERPEKVVVAVQEVAY
ncbi:MAG: alpha/beta fold hydrolase [Pseudomonadota bacterium]